MRIKLFNKKTLYEFYDFDLEMHIDFNKDMCRAILVSKEITLGPRIVYCYVRIINQDLPNFDYKKHIKNQMENEFIHHLNNNVGVECLIRKKEVPIKVYEGIKDAY